MPSGRRSFPRRPHTLVGWLLVAAVAGAAIVVAGGAFVYFAVFGTSSPPPLALSTPSSTTTGSGAQTSVVGAQTSVATAQLGGSWTVGNGSIAGYRVREQLGFLSAPSDAVGRTSSIKGAATLTDSAGALTVTTASFTVDVSTLTSDRSMRDERIRSIGLQSDQYPTATFVLTSPIQLPTATTTGQAVHVSAAGRLTIHGTTKTETIPLDARLSGAQIEVVGSITFPWSDFGMQAPSVGGFVTVTEQATMEFDLHLQHS
ncbi:MAG TPA: YceI family protein [Candidatus Dormibacteraeota bacterium]